MTVENFSPPTPYDIETAGPYSISFPYAAGAVRASVLLDGVLTPLAPGADFTVVPTAALDVAGDLTLSPAAFAAWQGGKLFIDRATSAEQGWLGQMTREKGLEAQMDMTVMAVQELQVGLSRSLRAAVPLQPFAPGGDGTLLLWMGDTIIPGPTAEHIAGAEGFALSALASAQAAAESAAEALAKENSMLRWAGAWVTATAYSPSDIVFNAGSAYICILAHASGAFATDLSAGRWAMMVQQGAAGPGSGDMLKSENLSGLVDPAVARTNLELGSIVLTNFPDPPDASVSFRGDGTWDKDVGRVLAWVNFNGTGTVAIRASGNVSSITDNGTGNYTINFEEDLPDANYACICSAGKMISDTYTYWAEEPPLGVGVRSANAVRIWTGYVSGTNAGNYRNFQDLNNISVLIIG